MRVERFWGIGWWGFGFGVYRVQDLGFRASSTLNTPLHNSPVTVTNTSRNPIPLRRRDGACVVHLGLAVYTSSPGAGFRASNLQISTLQSPLLQVKDMNYRRTIIPKQALTLNPRKFWESLRIRRDPSLLLLLLLRRCTGRARAWHALPAPWPPQRLYKLVFQFYKVSRRALDWFNGLGF